MSTKYIDELKKAYDECVDSLHGLHDLIYGNVNEYESVDELTNICCSECGGYMSKEECLKNPGLTCCQKECDCEEDALEQNAEVTTGAVVVTTNSGEGWEKGISTEFISSQKFSLPEDDVKGYDDAIEKHGKRVKIPREAYQPNLKKCDGCGVEFDYNQEYPVGTLDSSRGLKCNKCRTKA